MFNKIVNKINKCFVNISAVIVLAIILLCFCQVMARYVLHVAAPWSEELAKSGFLWMCMLCCGICVFDESNPVMSMLPDVLGRRGNYTGKAIHGIIVHIIMLVTILIIICATITIYTGVSISETPIIGINFSYLYLSFIVGGFVTVLNIVLKIIELIKELSRRNFREVNE